MALASRMRLRLVTSDQIQERTKIAAPASPIQATECVEAPGSSTSRNIFTIRDVNQARINPNPSKGEQKLSGALEIPARH